MSSTPMRGTSRGTRRCSAPGRSPATTPTATKPFGAIDTPSQGGTTSGANFVNFGWALTQNPKFIPTDGSTINVLVDGSLVGKADYNHFRSDIAGLFPGLANSNAAVGFRILDTTALANGLHTISWAVTDNAGAIEGIGSRFFTVANGAGAAPVPAAAVEAVADDRRDSGAAAVSALAIAAAPIDEAPVIGRRGWDLDAPWHSYAIGRSGRAVMRGEEIDRFELWLGAREGATYTGYLRVGQALAPLPIGSRLEPPPGRSRGRRASASSGRTISCSCDRPARTPSHATRSGSSSPRKAAATSASRSRSTRRARSKPSSSRSWLEAGRWIWMRRPAPASRRCTCGHIP